SNGSSNNSSASIMDAAQQGVLLESTGKRTYELPIPFSDEPTPLEVRENLAEILRQQMIGPSGGEDEVLTARVQPVSIYMFGRIAPVMLGDSSPSEEEPDAAVLADADVPTGSSSDVEPDAQGEDASSD